MYVFFVIEGGHFAFAGNVFATASTIFPFWFFPLVVAMQWTQNSMMPEELEKAYALYSKILVRHCRYRMFSKEDSEEIVQDAFMNVYQYMQNGHKVENIRVFLYTVTNNLIIDKARQMKAKREQQVSLDEMTEKGVDLRNEDDLTQRMHRKLQAEAILNAVKKLEKEDYELLVMRYIDGLMPTDIAQVTGKSTNVVSVKLHRALAKASTSLSIR